MNSISVYLDIAPDLQDVLLKLSVTIESLIETTVPETQVSYGVMPLFDNDTPRSKDIVPIIAVTATGLSMIMISLSKLLGSYLRRPHVYEWDEIEELRDNGEIVRDAYGNPIWKSIRKHAILDPGELKDDCSIEFNAGTKGIVFRIDISKG